MGRFTGWAFGMGWFAIASLCAGCQVTVVREPLPTAQGGFAPPEPIVVDARPPPPHIEERPDKPDDRSVWIAGHWDWMDSRFVWVPGRWEAPRPGYEWVAPRAERDASGRWLYVRGHWRPAQ